ncbi:MAG TPA: xanthine dehydrogenase accessory protein XdhC [Aliiroseovarius sp.]|nr:xanthine dehydrogenase accessory protein XdhC [Aliiroseovarius sp.]
MSFDPATLTDAVRSHGRVCRVVVARVQGSAPREVGASMLVWPGGQSGTIGGGALEYEAVRKARALLGGGGERALECVPLGPALGQCCGGAVTLLSEVFSEETLQVFDSAPVFARPCRPGTPEPLAVTRLLARVRASGVRPGPVLIDGWMVEPVSAVRAPLWIYGAGHVGRALVDVITPLPNFVITWVDTAPDRFPDEVPAGVTTVPAAQPDLLARRAPADAHHLILTYSHALDLALCHALLAHEFASAGLIGSATKWARFQSRLAALGHGPDDIGRITCPIGEPGLGKHPQAIAIGVARHLITLKNNIQTNRENDHERSPRQPARAAQP